MVIPIRGSEFLEDALRKVSDPTNRRFSLLHGQPVMMTPPRTWSPITWCSECDEDLDPDGTVFYDEVNNRIHCQGCAGG